MKLGSAWLDRYEAIRDAEKKWQQSVAEFLAHVPGALHELVDEMITDTNNFQHIPSEDYELGTDADTFRIIVDEENPNSSNELLAKLEELRELWKDEAELSLEPTDISILVSVKTIFPPMRYLKMKLEQDHPDAVCDWNRIPAAHDEMWSIRFTLGELELIIIYDMCQTPEKMFCISYKDGNCKSYHATPSNVLDNVDDRVRS